MLAGSAWAGSTTTLGASEETHPAKAGGSSGLGAAGLAGVTIVTGGVLVLGTDDFTGAVWAWAVAAPPRSAPRQIKIEKQRINMLRSSGYTVALGEEDAGKAHG